MLSKSRYALLALALAGCGGAALTEEHELGAGRSEIKGGVINNGDPQVFMISIEYPNGDAYLCTSTLIGRRTLLTAAHCVDKVNNQQPSRIRAHNLTTRPATDAPEWIDAVEHWVHPNWRPDQLQRTADVALIKLGQVVALKPKPFNIRKLTPWLGATVRATGYGITDSGGTGSGTKRMITMKLRGLNPSHLTTGDPGQGGICQGDSGGPTFFVFPDGIERQIGIHSYGSSEGGCEDGTAVRTDYYDDDILEILAGYEAATCEADRACDETMTCMTADPDCACVADDVCEPTCADKSTDPDCAEACIANGVCAITCASRDEDCSEPFAGCEEPEDCASRICATDPQAFGNYCSQACANSTECPSGYECAESVCKRVQLPVAGAGEPCTAGETYCSDGLACTGPAGEPTTCQKRCYTPIACDLTCNAGTNGINYCSPLLGQAEPEPEDPGGCGCGAVPGSAMALFALVAALGRAGLRRRRPFA